MKLKNTINTSKVVLLAAVLLVACLFAGVANAQSAFQGKFTLQDKTRWSDAVLPAGSYFITLDCGTGVCLAAIRNAENGKTVAHVLSGMAENGANGESALLISGRGAQVAVHSFRVAELGKTFIYDRTLAHGRGVREDGSKTEVVPVIVATK
jgi:hypothetical protein